MWKFNERYVIREPKSLNGSLLQGIWLGLKWMTFIMGPIAILGLLSVVGTTLYRFFFVNGMMIITNPELRWESLKLIGSPFGF
jgi:hypothetical protein